MSNWNRVQLEVCAGDDISKAHAATLFLSRSQGQAVEKLLQSIEAHNVELSTTLWMIVSRRNEVKDLFRQRIRDNGYTTHYRLMKIPVHGLQKKYEGKDRKQLPVHLTESIENLNYSILYQYSSKDLVIKEEEETELGSVGTTPTSMRNKM